MTQQKPLTQGLREISLGQYRAAHTRAINMIHADVSDAAAYCLLGKIAADHNNHLKACELYEKAVQLDSSQACYYAYLGQVLTTLGHQNKAREAADHAANLVVDDAFTADTIGVIYSRTGYHELAIPFFEMAVAMDDRPANFFYNLAASQQFLGHFELAESNYHQTLKRDARAYRAWSSLVGLNRQAEDKNHLQALTQLFQQLAEDADASLHLGHAIAKTLEDLGRYEESLDWLQKAKHLKLKQSDKPSFSYENLFDAAKTTAPFKGSNSSSTSTRSRNFNPSDAPIFIIGLPRTGTTLVDRIISSHPQAVSAGELNVFPGLIKQATRTPSNMVMDVATFGAASAINFAEIGDGYLAETMDHRRGARRFTDKMPLNFFYAGLIHQALPNARIVALRRGAMDSCLSNYRQLLTVQHSYYHYTYDLQQVAMFYRGFDQLIAHWRETIPADRFMEIAYEDIVFDQEAQTRKLLDFCQLQWNEACLRFHENEAPVSTASSVQVRQPLYSGSVDRWKRYGDKLEGLKEALGELA